MIAGRSALADTRQCNRVGLTASPQRESVKSRRRGTAISKAVMRFSSSRPPGRLVPCPLSLVPRPLLLAPRPPASRLFIPPGNAGSRQRDFQNLCVFVQRQVGGFEPKSERFF